MLPILGSDDDVADLKVDGDLLRLGDLALPIAPGTGDGQRPRRSMTASTTGWWAGATGSAVIAASSRSPRWPGCGRRIRAVFDASHAEVARWFSEGLVDGVRIDHPDGLSDPCGYLARLRELLGPDAWIVIEKILAVDEALEPTLPVAGTTGYDVLRRGGRRLRRPERRRSAHRARRLGGQWTTTRCRGCSRTSRSARPPRRWPASWPGCDEPSRRRRAPIIRCCPRRWPHCSPTSGSTAATTPAWPRCCPPRWPKPRRRHRNWDPRCR